MLRNIFVIIINILLFCSLSFADKTENKDLALTKCPACSISATDYTGTNYSFDYTYGYEYANAYTIITVSSVDTITQVHIALKIGTDNFYDVAIIDTLFNNFESLITEQFYDGDNYWVYIRMYGLNTVFSNTELFKLHFTPTNCMSELDSLTLAFENYDDSGYINILTAKTDTYQFGNLENAQFKLVTPDVDLSMLQPNEIPGNIRDSNYVGGSILVPVYITSNISYYDGYSFTIHHDSSLIYNTIDYSEYTYGISITGSTSTSVSFSASPPFILPPLPDRTEVFFNIVFSFDTLTAEYDTKYHIWIEDQYTFTGCPQYSFTATPSSADTAIVKTVKPSTTIKFLSATVNKGSSNFPYYFQIKNNVPLITNDDLFRISFIEPDQNAYTTYVEPSEQYEFDPPDKMYYNDFMTQDTIITVQEHSNYVSNNIPIYTTFKKIGYLTMNPGGIVGTDTLNFFSAGIGHPLNNKDNYVVTRYTYDTLLTDDSTLFLIPGTIYVRNPPSGGGGCPTLYSWNGNNFIMENPILTHSQSSPVPASDYYPLALGIIPKDGFYKIQVREDENEITYLDNLELIVVDYPIDKQIAISTEGEIYTYDNKLEPIAAIDHNRKNILPMITAEDELYYESGNSGSILVTFKNPYFDSKNSNSNLSLNNSPGVFSLESTPPPKEQGGDENPLNEGKELTGINVEILNNTGEWIELGKISPRAYDGDNSQLPFNIDDLQLGETIEIKITWQGYFRTDIQNLKIGKGSDFISYKLQATDAEHSLVGKATAFLTNTDDDIITLSPGENIIARFPVPANEIPVNHVRKFILKSHGYYTAYKSGILPGDFALHDNYPNPFNPATNIGFSLPSASEVTLKVYNVLGQEVKTLINETMSVGYHSIEWSGDNNNGDKVASGVYFYRIQAGDFKDSKKMVLLK